VYAFDRGNILSELISIKEAVARNIERLRQPQWIIPEDHIKLDLLGNAKCGPWVHLYSPFNLVCNGRDPISSLMFSEDINAVSWLVYEGALPESEKYKLVQAAYKADNRRDSNE
jgi:hypothetical protein